MNAPAWPAAPQGHEAFDLLATMVALVRPDGRCLFANAAFENVLGLSRRSVLKRDWFGWFHEADLLRETVAAVPHNEFSTSRLEAQLRRPGRAAQLTGGSFESSRFSAAMSLSERSMPALSSAVRSRYFW